MNPFLHLHFVFENSQNSISCDPPFSLFWSVKYPNFGQKLRIRIVRYSFLGDILRVLKICIVLSPEWSQKGYWLVNYFSLLSVLGDKGCYELYFVLKLE